VSCKREIDTLLAQLDALVKKDPRCGSMTCTTCGGFGFHIFNNLSHELKSLIDHVLAEATLDEFDELGDWKFIIMRSNQDKVLGLYNRATKNLDINNPRKLDKFLYSSKLVNGKNYHSPENSILEQAATSAIKTEDISLIETILLTEKDYVLNNNQLLNLAIEKSKDNSQLKKALYNRLREEIPEVRDLFLTERGCNPLSGR
jgi:hypothetical protein